MLYDRDYPEVINDARTIVYDYNRDGTFEPEKLHNADYHIEGSYGVPIPKETVSFSRYKQAIDFKVQAPKIERERQRTNNGRLMNVLLYVLALIGSAQTLQVLQTELGLPFNIAFWVVIGVFIVFGIVWVLREIRKQ